MGVFHAAFGFFLTWWGAYLLAALDSTMVFFLPFGVDALVIYLSARSGMFFWIYPLLAAAGPSPARPSRTGLASKVGEMGLEHFVPSHRFERFRHRVQKQGRPRWRSPRCCRPLSADAVRADMRRARDRSLDILPRRSH